jgi:hypothetical protein
VLVPVHPEPGHAPSTAARRARARPDPRDPNDPPRPGGHVHLHPRYLLVGGRGHPEVRHRQAHTQYAHRRLPLRALRLLHERRLQEREYLEKLGLGALSSFPRAPLALTSR